MLTNIRHPFPEVSPTLLENRDKFNVVIDLFSIFAAMNSEQFLMDNAVTNSYIESFIAPPLKWVYNLTKWLHNMQYRGVIPKQTKIRIFLVSEKKGFNYVKDQDKSYKSNRKYKFKELADKRLEVHTLINRAVNTINNAALNIGVVAFNIGGVEADFCIYKVCEIHKSQENYNLIIGADKDYGQILTSNTHQFRFTRKYFYNDESEKYECAEKLAKYIMPHTAMSQLLKIELESIVSPQLFAIILSIIGDASDGIKGVKGIAQKKLQCLLLLIEGSNKPFLLDCKTVDDFIIEIQKYKGISRNVDRDIDCITEGKDVIEENMKKIYFPEVEKYIASKVDLDFSVKVLLRAIDNKYNKMDVKSFFSFLNTVEPSISKFVGGT
jgi:5'-3' exonuclease